MIIEILNKSCSKCEIVKPACEFHKNRSECKSCAKKYKEIKKESIREQKKKYYTKNKDRIKLVQSNYTENNKNKVKQTKKKYRDSNKSKISEYHKKRYKEKYLQMKNARNLWYANNREEKLIKNKIWRDNNKDRAARLSRDWALNNKEKRRKTYKKWFDKNKENIAAKRRVQRRNRIKSDLTYRSICMLRNATQRVLKYGSKPKGTLELLGCPPEVFQKYIESKFLEGMTWDNWSNGQGKWNLDHIKPISSFDFTKADSWKECFHYTNLQPLWWEDNMAKGNKLDWNNQTK